MGMPKINDYDEYWKFSMGLEKGNFWEKEKRIIKKIILENYVPGRNVLDCGCGRGDYLVDIDGEKFGIDISDVAFKKSGITGIKFKVADFEKNIPFDDGKFHNVICIEVIEHIRNSEKLMNEISRVMQRGGILILSTPYHGFIKNIICAATNFEEHFNSGIHIRFFTRKSLRNLLEKNGFEILKYYNVGRFFPVEKSMVVVARKK